LFKRASRPRLAWPVIEYVNRSATVKTEMLKIINAYLAMRIARRG
jgi:hypothetical protein